MDHEAITVGLDAVIVAVTDNEPRILTVVDNHGFDSLPAGPLDPVIDPTLERALRRWVLEQAGFDVGYVEQLYTFGDRNRDPRSRIGGARVLSIAYLALVREEEPSAAGAAWRNWYDYFPWEDHRAGRPTIINSQIAPALEGWIESAQSDDERESRRVRSQIAFGMWGAPWDGVRVLERYELMYEAGIVEEAHTDGLAHPAIKFIPSSGMTLDHRRIAATAMSRLRGKLTYRPVVFELLGDTFTLRHLQHVVEALSGVQIHTQNFRRLVETGGLVEGTGDQEKTRGRPAELFRFRRDVLTERPRPGLGTPGVRR